MKDSVVRDALKHIQDIIAGESGAPLHGEAELRLADVLRNAITQSAGAPNAETFLSREVTILLADLRGFTSITATYPAGTVLEMLNRCLVKLCEIVARHEGTVHKFMGDSIMVLFGVPVAREDDVKRALRCAVDMQLAMDEINRHYKQAGLPDLYLGIGVNTGTVMAGLLGSHLYSEYTVIGDDVNLTSRIEAFSLRGQVLISQSTFERCQDFLTTSAPMNVYVKGKPAPVSLREVLAIPSTDSVVPRQEIRRSPRVEVKIPFTFQVIQNDIVIPRVHQGAILDIGYFGILAELDEDLPRLLEIKIEMHLPLVGYTAGDLYAKIVSAKPREGRNLSGIEFTSVSAQCNTYIQLLVQLLIQGSENK